MSLAGQLQGAAFLLPCALPAISRLCTCVDGLLRSSKLPMVKAGSSVCRFARVTNLNDCVTRIPTFFTDTGEPFVHADGKHSSWCA